MRSLASKFDYIGGWGVVLTGKSYSFRSCVRASEAVCVRDDVVSVAGFFSSKNPPGSRASCLVVALFFFEIIVVVLLIIVKSMLIIVKSMLKAFRCFWKRLETVR